MGVRARDADRRSTRARSSSAIRRAGSTIATGDAVNVAARLEQAAQPGEILLGRETHRLVRDRSRAPSPLEPLALKGKARPVSAWRLVDGCRRARRAELRAARLAARRPRAGARRRCARPSHGAVDDRACRLVTVLGAARRRQVAARAGARRRARLGAPCSQGRCLPVRRGHHVLARRARSCAPAPGIADGRRRPRRARAKLAALRRPATRRRSSPSGSSASLGARRRPRATEESSGPCAGSSRRSPRTRPLVLVLEDLHWAEPTLLDLSSTSSTGRAARRCSCSRIARPELLDARPAWPRRGALDCSSRSARDEVRALLAKLLGSAPPTPPSRRASLEAAEGNPLFVEEIVRDARRRRRRCAARTAAGSRARSRARDPADDQRAARRAPRPARRPRSATVVAVRRR